MAVRGHVLRGAVGGGLFGVALATMLTLYGVVRLGEFTAGWIVLLGVVLGVVWALVAPAPRRRGAPAPETEPKAE